MKLANKEKKIKKPLKTKKDIKNQKIERQKEKWLTGMKETNGKQKKNKRKNRKNEVRQWNKGNQRFFEEETRKPKKRGKNADEDISE